jgi:hypothetical protein
MKNPFSHCTSRLFAVRDFATRDISRVLLHVARRCWCSMIQTSAYVMIAWRRIRRRPAVFVSRGVLELRERCGQQQVTPDSLTSCCSVGVGGSGVEMSKLSSKKGKVLVQGICNNGSISFVDPAPLGRHEALPEPERQTQ